MASLAQMFSCVGADQIRKFPTNNSTSKQHWTFSKNARFPLKKPYCDSIYNIPDCRSKRKTSQGYGKKTDLRHGEDRHNITPAPTTYSVPNFIELNKKRLRGYSVGEGREETAPRSYIELDPQKVPGPGAYAPNKAKDTPYWSMRPKTAKEIFPQTTQLEVPGPGNYESIDGFQRCGKYRNSKHNSSGSKMFNPKSSERFAKSTTISPGPGAYKPKNDLSEEGHYVLSKNGSNGRRAFLNSARDSFVDDGAKRAQTPGPGSYRRPSDFGHYDQLPLNGSQINTTRSRKRSKA